jgi:hypothetical protein
MMDPACAAGVEAIKAENRVSGKIKISDWRAGISPGSAIAVPGGGFITH